jgi:hypothetical protein
MDGREAIRIALKKLVERSNEDAFVIIEDNSTKKFVQFAGGKMQDLVFDLPTQTLSSHELVRAKDALARFNIQLEEWNVYDRPGGKVVGTQSGFSKNLGKDVDIATEIAWTTLTEIYRLGQALDLSIEEN